MSETYFNDADIGAGWPAIRALMPGDPVLGGLDGVSNAPAKGLMQRTILLKAMTDTMADDLAALSDQVDLLSSADGPALEDALRALLEERWPWRYYEVFSPGWTLIQTPDRQPLPVTVLTTPVPGDDSLDVSDTATLRAGSGYVVRDAAGRQEVTITEVLTATRIRITPALAIPLAAGAQIAQTDWAVAPRAATAAPGSTYYARPIDLGPAAGQRAIVVRSAPTAATLRAWWRPAGGSWTECVWSWRRAGTDYAGQDWQEIEYILPAAGLTQVRVTIDPETPEVSIDPVTIRRITIMEGPTGLGGVGNGPIRPAALSPAAGAVGVGSAPTLTLSAYASPTGAAQAGLELELRQGAITLLATGLIAGIAAGYSLAPGVLLPASSYSWRGRYHDSRGVPSLWSDWSPFSTSATFSAIQPPTLLAPAAGAGGRSRSPTLTTAPLSIVGGSDIHVGSQWQVATSDSFASPTYDSGDVTDLTSHAVSIGLAASTTYWWRVRFRAAGLGWSDWSAPRQFTTDVLAGSQVFTTGSGSFVVPAGVYRLRRIVVGGGGGAARTTSFSSEQAADDGGHGGTSSISPLGSSQAISATGGGGGLGGGLSRPNPPPGGAGGNGVGGDINISGQAGGQGGLDGGASGAVSANNIPASVAAAGRGGRNTQTGYQGDYPGSGGGGGYAEDTIDVEPGWSALWQAGAAGTTHGSVAPTAGVVAFFWGS